MIRIGLSSLKNSPCQSDWYYVNSFLKDLKIQNSLILLIWSTARRLNGILLLLCQVLLWGTLPGTAASENSFPFWTVCYGYYSVNLSSCNSLCWIKCFSQSRDSSSLRQAPTWSFSVMPLPVVSAEMLLRFCGRLHSEIWILIFGTQQRGIRNETRGKPVRSCCRVLLCPRRAGGCQGVPSNRQVAGMVLSISALAVYNPH